MRGGTAFPRAEPEWLGTERTARDRPSPMGKVEAHLSARRLVLPQGPLAPGRERVSPPQSVPPCASQQRENSHPHLLRWGLFHVSRGRLEQDGTTMKQIWCQELI